MSEKRLRMTIDITPRQHRFLINLSHGWRKQIFGTLIDLIIDMVNRNGVSSLSNLMTKGTKLEEFIQENEDGY